MKKVGRGEYVNNILVGEGCLINNNTKKGAADGSCVFNTQEIDLG